MYVNLSFPWHNSIGFALSLGEQVFGPRHTDRSQASDPAALEAIVHDYGDLLLCTSWLIVGDQSTAEDVVQDSLILAWKHLPTLHSKDSLKPWLLKIVANQSISFKRRTAHMLHLFLQTPHAPGHERAMQIWQQAQAIITTIKDSEARTRALSRLGQALTEEHLWQEAHAIIATLEENEARALVLSSAKFLNSGI